MHKILPLLELRAALLAISSFAMVSSRGLQSTVDLATCVPGESNFNIQLVNMGQEDPTDSRYVEAFTKAAERWQKVVVGDLPSFPAGVVSDWFQGCFSRPYNGAVDDLVIGYDISRTLDGPGGTLGRAGGVFLRTNNAGRALSTVSGVMEFDRVDLDRMPIDDVKAIILHEMGHVLGLVGLNGRCASACDPNNPSRQGTYKCSGAREEYEALVPPDKQLVLENNGGMGTACGHWEEDIFRTQESSELMTGFFESNIFQPLSLVTVAALDDIGGYQVDYCGADIWPADENTIKRYDIFRTQNNMDVSDEMENVFPSMGMDESGRPNPLTGSDSTSAALLSQPFVGFIMLSVSMAGLGLGFFS